LANFDFIAPVYDLLARIVFGTSIRKAQTYYLNQIPDGARVLILGGGTGWLLEEISDQSLRIDYVDLSKKMLKRAKKRQVSFAMLRFIHGNEETVADQLYDIVITPFVLDTCTENQLPPMIETIEHLVDKNGLWLCTDFNSQDQSFKARALDLAMRVFFRTVSGLKLKRLLPYFEAIGQAGFKEIDTNLFYGGFIKASLFKRARSLKRTI